jgi:hypothetical protein
MTDLIERLDALERRLREVEDHLAIFKILATYGPGVDSMVTGPVGALWIENGVYDAGGFEPFVGKGIVDHLYHDWHQRVLAAGCAHVMSMPLVAITGDTAVATSYSQVCVRHESQWIIERASANRWEFIRVPGGWKVTHRLNRPLDGTDASKAVLAAGLTG